MDQPGDAAILSARLASVALAVAVTVRGAAQQPTPRTAAPWRAPAVLPAADPARGADAELRVALFDLATGRPLAAARRLEQLRASMTSATPADDALRTRADALFLLAESYYRLGRSDAFRATAQELATSPGGARYAPMLDVQLALDAYRRGDDAEARALAGRVSGAGGPLAALVAGLAAYRAGDYAAARTSFARVRAAGVDSVYVPYARAMEALAVMQGDTARAADALRMLRPVPAGATGAAADQLRLTAAALAYEQGRYDVAAAYADSVSATGPLGVPALRTKAWALYGAGQLAAARAAFAELAARHPELPQRDEARLMIGQLLLEAGDAAAAERYFAALADSLRVDAGALAARVASLPAEARTLVQARAARLAFLPAPADGGAFALPDDAGAEDATVLAAFAHRAAPAAGVAPAPVSLAAIEARLDSLRPALGADGMRRLLLAAPSSPAAAAAFAAGARALHEADLAVTAADANLQRQLVVQGMTITVLQELEQLVASGRAALAANAGVLAATQDSLDRLRGVMAGRRARLREALASQIAETRRLANATLVMLDSVRTSLGPHAGPVERDILRTEAQAAAAYQTMAEMAARGLDAAIDRHPVFALRDSLARRLERARAAHDAAQAVLAQAGQAAAEALAELHGSESEGTRAARAALAAAVTQRSMAEENLVALLEAELRARAAAAADSLRHARELAEYGAANAAFFRATTAAGAGTVAAAGREPREESALQNAIDKMSAFLASYPASRRRPDAMLRLGELLVRRADETFAAAQRAGGDAVPERPDYRAAIARYEELVREYPAFADADAAAYTLGTLYFTDQRYADAARMFELVTARSASPFRSEAFFRLGDARFELAAHRRGAERRALLAQAALAYESATATAPAGSDIYFLALYKLGWSYYNQATRPSEPQYDLAVNVFGRLVAEYDRLPPERQARLGLRTEAIEYMAVALTQVGGAEAANRYFATHPAASFKLAVLRRVAASLRDQGDFAGAVEGYQAVLMAAPTDPAALDAQREIIDIYQNRVLDPARAQAARLALVDRFAPGTPWAEANPALRDSAAAARETALRQSAQYALAGAQRTRNRARFAAAAELYARYLREFASTDSAQAAGFLYGEALFGQGEYARAGAAYSRAAYALPGHPDRAARAGQNAIVAFDSALVHDRANRALQDSLFAAVDRYVATFPNAEVATKALIEKGKRASEAERWDVVAETFRTYAAKYPDDPYTPTAEKLVGDALYKQGRYAEAQAQWALARTDATRAGRQALADSIAGIRMAAAVTFGDSLVRAGAYDRAAEEVYIAFADLNPTSPRAPDALRNAVESYLLADSAARARGDTAAAYEAMECAYQLSRRLVTRYPNYRYRAQYQVLQARLLADLGRADEAVRALEALIRDNPEWSGRADAMVRRAVMLDSLHRAHDAAAAYEAFGAAYPQDARAADALYNAAVTYLQAADTAAAARAYGAFATRFPRDARAARAVETRVALLAAAGDAAALEAELARRCARPSPGLAAACAARAGEREFRAGVALFAQYQRIRLVIPNRASLTRAGIEKLSAPKRRLLTTMTQHFSRSIATGAPEWLAASSYFVGLAQWEYGNYLRNVELPADLTGPELSAAQTGAAQQAAQYVAAARRTWQALVDKAEQEQIANPWVDRARAALAGNVDTSPPVDGARER